MVRYGRCWMVCGLLVGAVGAIRAQTLDPAPRFDAAQELFPAEPEPEPMPSDTLLFYPRLDDDAYVRLTAYRFPVARNARGEGFDREAHRIAGIGVPAAARAALRALRLGEVRYGGLDAPPGMPSGAAGLTEYAFDAAQARAETRIALDVTDRRYRARLRLTDARQWGAWSYVLALGAQTGHDAHVRGVFLSSLVGAAVVRRDLGPSGALSLLVADAPTERGLRSTSTEEVFRLRGDPFYNPSWGLQRGKRRNQRVLRTHRPFVLLAYSGRAERTTRWQAAVGLVVGRQARSALDWYDATTPIPDHYRNLPSWYPREEVNEAVAEAWRAGEPAVTQVDWAGLYARNRGGGSAHYLLADRVEARCGTEALVHATTRSGVWTLDYGMRLAASSTRCYKEVRDLLGAAYVEDVDQFWQGDDRLGPRAQNDLQHPDRRVFEGGRFGYDYRIDEQSAALFAAVGAHAGHWQWDATASMGVARLRRRGYCEKEFFPGGASLGPSRWVRLHPFEVRAHASYAFSARHAVGLRLLLAAVPPGWRDLYLNPDYNNRSLDGARCAERLGVELHYAYRSEILLADVRAYALWRRHETEMYRYYDDLQAVYADLATEHIERLSTGIEVALSLPIAARLRLAATFGYGRHVYASDPRLSLYSDSGNACLAEGLAAHLKGLRLGGAPGVEATAGLRYGMNRGWAFALDAAYAADRRVEPAPMRRTERVAGTAPSPEVLDALVRQERLPAAFTLDVQATRSILFAGGSRLTLFASVRNLLGRRRTLWDGYESMRLKAVGGETLRFAPMPTRYLYADPRTLYFSVTYAF